MMKTGRPISTTLVAVVFLVALRTPSLHCHALASVGQPEEHHQQQEKNSSNNVQGSLPLTADGSSSEGSDYDPAHHHGAAPTDDDTSHHLSDVAINLAERPPRFEDASGQANVTVQLGGTAFLNCKVLDLQDKTQVSWVRRHEQELHLLTVGMQTYSTDSRFSLHFQHPNDWRLQIKYARPRDEGIYECQVSIHPPRIYTVRLVVVVPSVEMVDDHGRVIEEKIYKTGSTIELKCVVSKVPGPTANVMWRHGARLLNYDTSRGGISVKTDLLPYGAVSRLYIANASQRDAGNYTCAISESSSTTVMVHILNGEHPAAMQHGQSSCSEKRPISLVIALLATWVFMWKYSSR